MQVMGRSSLYTYNGLHRLSEVDIGRLNSGRTDILDEWADPQPGDSDYGGGRYEQPSCDCFAALG